MTVASVTAGAAPKIVFRASARASKNDLEDRFGPLLSGLDERVAQSLLNFERVWKNTSKGKSRYSNGAYPVLYTATTEEVAFVEKGYWVIEYVLKPMKIDISLPPYVLYKVVVSGTFEEHAIDDDLRIVHPSDYAFCHAIGQQAVADGHAYLVVPSARVVSGICVPVFRKDLSEIEEHDVDTFTYTWDASHLKLSASWRGKTIPSDAEDVYSAAGGT